MTCSGQVHRPHFQHVFLYDSPLLFLLNLLYSPFKPESAQCLCVHGCKGGLSGAASLKRTDSAFPSIHQLWSGTLCRSSPCMLGFKSPFSCACSHGHWEFTCVTTLSFRKLLASHQNPLLWTCGTFLECLLNWTCGMFVKHLFVRDFPTFTHVLTHATFSPIHAILNSNLSCSSSETWLLNLLIPMGLLFKKFLPENNVILT